MRMIDHIRDCELAHTCPTCRSRPGQRCRAKGDKPAVRPHRPRWTLFITTLTQQGKIIDPDVWFRPADQNVIELRSE